MSLFSAVTKVAKKAGYEVDASVGIASVDVTTLQLVQIAQDVIEEMADKYCWPKLWKDTSITLATSTATYALPGDFSYPHYETFWNSTNGFRLYGPIAANEYGENLGYGLSADLFDNFAIRGVTDNEILIYPTPTSTNNGETVLFQYQSARPVRPKTWVTATVFAAGAYCFYNGNYYSTVAGGTTGATAPTHTTSSASDGGVTWVIYLGAYRNFLADTDEVVLNERILRQGMLERFGGLKGLSIDPMFDLQLAEEYSRIAPARTVFASSSARPKQDAFNGVVRFRS
jgi:hypothetical protein